MRKFFTFILLVTLVAGCASYDHSGQGGPASGFSIGTGGGTISSETDDTDSGTGGR